MSTAGVNISSGVIPRQRGGVRYQGPYAGRRRKYILCVSIKLVFTSPLLTPYLRKMECVSMVAFRSRGVSHFGIQVEYLRMFRIQVEQLKFMRKYHVRDICNSYFRCE